MSPDRRALIPHAVLLLYFVKTHNFHDIFFTLLGIVRESEKSGKSYAVFSIRVTKLTFDDEEIWDVYRRFSDFHDLQMIMSEKVSFMFIHNYDTESEACLAKKNFFFSIFRSTFL